MKFINRYTTPSVAQVNHCKFLHWVNKFGPVIPLTPKDGFYRVKTLDNITIYLTNKPNVINFNSVIKCLEQPLENKQFMHLRWNNRYKLLMHLLISGPINTVKAYKCLKHISACKDLSFVERKLFLLTTTRLKSIGLI